MVMPVLFTFAQVREDLSAHLTDLSTEQIWCRTGAGSLGFHLKHITGSVDRLTTYLLGGQLSAEQLSYLQNEDSGDNELADLLAQLDASLQYSEERLRTIDPGTFSDPRTVGRQALPTTVIGLIVHLAEHTQRHLGQAITMSKILREAS